MPLITEDEDLRQIGSLPRHMTGAAAPDPFAPTPTFADTLNAAWEEGVPYAAYKFAHKVYDLLSSDPSAAVDPTFNPFELIRGTKYEADHGDEFIGVPNKKAFAALIVDIDRRDDARSILEGGGWKSDASTAIVMSFTIIVALAIIAVSFRLFAFQKASTNHRPLLHPMAPNKRDD